MAVDITGLSLVVANMLGVSEAFGGAFCAFVMWLSVVGTFTVINKRALTNNMFIVLSFFVLSLSTLAGWLDYWWLLMVIALIAIFGAYKMGTR